MKFVQCRKILILLGKKMLIKCIYKIVYKNVQIINRFMKTWVAENKCRKARSFSFLHNVQLSSFVVTVLVALWVRTAGRGRTGSWSFALDNKIVLRGRLEKINILKLGYNDLGYNQTLGYYQTLGYIEPIFKPNWSFLYTN